MRRQVEHASGAGDLASLHARGADVHALGRALDNRAHTLDVGHPHALGADVRVGNRVAEAGALATNVTVRSHGKLLDRNFGWNRYGAFQLELARASPAADSCRLAMT